MNKLEQRALLEEQFNACIYCEREIYFGAETKLTLAVVDHNHSTGKVRGYACHPCNTMIGYIENNNINLDRVKNIISPNF